MRLNYSGKTVSAGSAADRLGDILAQVKALTAEADAIKEGFRRAADNANESFAVRGKNYTVSVSEPEKRVEEKDHDAVVSLVIARLGTEAVKVPTQSYSCLDANEKTTLLEYVEGTRRVTVR